MEDEKAAALEKLRQEALERVRAAEKKANAKLSGGALCQPAGPAVEWWDGPVSDGNAAGVLERGGLRAGRDDAACEGCLRAR